jgi:hypothetical protein
MRILEMACNDIVMAGLVPAIHALLEWRIKEDVDARHKAGHDGN